MEFFDTIRQVRNNWNPYKKWEIEQLKKEKQNDELRKKYPPTLEELGHAKQYGRTIVDAINVMDQHSIDKSEDAAFAVRQAFLFVKLAGLALGGGIGASGVFKRASQSSAEGRVYSSIIGMIIAGTVTSAACNIYGAQIEKQASRIARYQTREKDLKDFRNFVIYTPEQIQEAQELTKNMPDVKVDKNLDLKKSFNLFKVFSKAYKTTSELAKDYKEYSKWKNNYLKEEAIKHKTFKSMQPPEEKLHKAQKDRDIMLNTIRKIENSSLSYLMDMRLALMCFIIGISAAGMGLGIGFVKAMDKLQKNKLFVQKASGSNTAKLTGFKIIPIAFMILAVGPMIKLQKDAARIGRYKAKQEMLSNPQNFIGFDDEQRKQVSKEENIKTEKKSFSSELKKDLKNIKQLKKDYAEYHNYQNNEYKQELKLNEALKQVKISKEQEIAAKNLQKKAFYSFEKMDEKAQRFTDDTDAAVDITNGLISRTINGLAKIYTTFLAFKTVDGYKKDLNNLKTKELLKQIMSKTKGNDIIKVFLPTILAPALTIPFEIKGLQIKKEAGKIGVMTAMKDLDDPKNFLDDEKAAGQMSG